MRVSALLMIVAIILGGSNAVAQQFPSQPVRVVVPFPPGGGTDILVRLIQDKYSAKLGQPVVIDNRPGASGNIGAGVVAKSKADGHTLLVQATIVGIYPSIYRDLPYDPQKDFIWVGGVAESPAVIVTNPNSKYKTIADLMAEGKARRKQVNFASAGVGSPQHLATERLGRLNDVEFTHVPYKGSATAITDLLSGVLDFGTLSFSSVLPLIQEGKLRPLALASDRRSKLAPDVPTLKESGLGDVSGTVRFIIGAPAGTPDAAIEKLSADLNAVVKEPDIQKDFEKRGYEMTLASPKEVLAMVREQKELWEPLVRELKLKFD
ncbi:tripartite tricarboxylate transporter substrate binding protein [Pseudorhodoplanes sp.]|uniref:Bug family tripartite tricarboxylate transporter substrate binding protein n=1 Tax=Pseudorhodoplanes sp. TaxID=1934341 RepID=UPI002C337986|nr:tripartite tricarboxylate transporter substrate binding protein [Pseudorhodoplanes sp.]HWV51946.1 tripartite tricarboxylate transporter substrate binding protein [Pseudorhodoplanes sp.]